MLEDPGFSPVQRDLAHDRAGGEFKLFYRPRADVDQPAPTEDAGFGGGFEVPDSFVFRFKKQLIDLVTLFELL